MLKPLARVSFLALLLVTACANDAHDSLDSHASRSEKAKPSSGSTDPVAHLNVIASPSMEGRGTGSAGFHRAAEYIANECQVAGLSGAFPGSATPYFQPFTVGGFPAAPHASPEVEEDFGTDIFEEGLFVSGEASPQTLREMGKQLCSAWKAAGRDCPTGAAEGTTDPRPLVAAAATATENVVAILPGTGPRKDEVILLSAHLDHLGKTSSGVFFGADDNGSGSSSLVAIMHQLVAVQKARTFDRTIAFLWTSGEEKGLLGAAYFADNSPATLPLARIKQVVNMDMVGRWDDTRFSLGTDSTPATEATARVIEAANGLMERPFAKINRDVQSYARRQDGYAFSRKGVPALFVFEGLSRPTGGGSLIPQYHKTTDTIEAMMADNGGEKLRRVANVVAIAIEKLANDPPAAAE